MKLHPALILVISSSLLTGLQAQPASEAKPQPAPPAPKGPIEVNGIAAKVNGRVVTKNEVSFMLAPIYAQLASQYPRHGAQFEAKMKEAKNNIVQELVDRQIILDEFKKTGAQVKPHLIDEEIKRQIQQLFNNDESKFREELKRSRLTFEGYRTITREKLIVQSMRAQQFADAPPPLPQEVEAEYEAIKLTLRDTSKDMISFQKIFIPSADPQNPSSTPETQLALAEDLVKQLKDGKDFTEIAKANSKDAFAEKGGLLENIPRTDLSPEFAAIITDAPIGEILGPLVDPKGFTIIKPIKVEYGPIPALFNIRDTVEERVRKKKTSSQYERWIEARRKKAMIEIKI